MPINDQKEQPQQPRSGDRSNLTEDEWIAQRTADRLSVAIDDAMKALLKEDCASLFTTVAGRLTPTALLKALSTGQSGLGYFTLDKIISAPGQVTSATESVIDYKAIDIGQGAQQLVPSAVKITINRDAGSFQTGGRDDRLATIIHEIGHAYYDLFGPAASRIIPDGDDVKKSEANTALVRKKFL